MFYRSKKQPKEKFEENYSMLYERFDKRIEEQVNLNPEKLCFLENNNMLKEESTKFSSKLD